MSEALASAIATLFQAPLSQFVVVRKQLSNELRRAGDMQGARRLAKCKRPTLSVWLVNQLWWLEQETFQQMFASARELGEGAHDQAPRHHRLLADLRRAASNLLAATGHPASEATLRRVMTTLSALAAAGGFEPDPPGALERDREPPGFDALSLSLDPLPESTAPSAEDAPAIAGRNAAAQRETRRDGAAPLEERGGPARAHAAGQTRPLSRETEQARQREQAELARQREQAELARRRAAERARLEAALASARRVVEQHTREVGALDEQLTAARARLESAEQRLRQLEQALANDAQPG